jgi:hypothetical protein
MAARRQEEEERRLGRRRDSEASVRSHQRDKVNVALVTAATCFSAHSWWR